MLYALKGSVLYYLLYTLCWIVVLLYVDMQQTCPPILLQQVMFCLFLLESVEERGWQKSVFQDTFNANYISESGGYAKVFQGKNVGVCQLCLLKITQSQPCVCLFIVANCTKSAWSWNQKDSFILFLYLKSCR